ncbi:hypothetical protein H6B11_00365 [Mediterraneibacter glycyrrhizinilyticus]|nr:hypothetical protein [Mediterraneibacter glycyrrhizinilyticus]MBM6852631.1 hypothetical protein [Mediterraneibacter glycyrrhizinilyticus]
MKQEKLVIFESEDRNVELRVPIEDETVWLTQAQMKLLFEVDRTVITKHIRNIFRDEELEEKSNVHFLHIAQTVDKVPGLHRDFSIAVINISMILPVFIKKNSLLINSKVKRCVPCTGYNYPIRRFRL